MVTSQVFLIDDQELVLQAISGLIDSSGADQGVQVLGMAQSYEQALPALEREQPDLVLLDINMPSINGYETTYMLKKKWPGMKILMLTGQEDGAGVAQAKSAGADGYALKSGSSHDLMNAISDVLKGDQKFVISNGLMDLSIPDSIPDMGLTRRQRQVLKLLVYGETAKGIAKILAISPRTAEKHRAQVITKLNTPNAIEMVEYACLLGLPS